ncbi:hypothetical protein IAT40_007322 [Kwoniella sp. CBS 6097]
MSAPELSSRNLHDEALAAFDNMSGLTAQLDNAMRAYQGPHVSSATQKPPSDTANTEKGREGSSSTTHIYIPEGDLLPNRKIDPTNFVDQFQNRYKRSVVQSGTIGSVVNTSSILVHNATELLSDLLFENNEHHKQAQSKFVEDHQNESLEAIMSVYGTWHEHRLMPRFRYGPEPSSIVKEVSPDTTTCVGHHLDTSIYAEDVLKARDDLESKLRTETTNAQKRFKKDPSALRSDDPSFHQAHHTPEQQATADKLRADFTQRRSSNQAATRTALSSALTAGVDTSPAGSESAVDISNAFTDNALHQDPSFDIENTYFHFYNPNKSLSLPETLRNRPATRPSSPQIGSSGPEAATTDVGVETMVSRSSTVTLQ